MPKTFLAVNLSDAFTFQEKQHPSEGDALEMRPTEHEQKQEHEQAQQHAEIAPAPGPTTSDPPKPDVGGD